MLVSKRDCSLLGRARQLHARLRRPPDVYNQALAAGLRSQFQCRSRSPPEGSECAELWWRPPYQSRRQSEPDRPNTQPGLPQRHREECERQAKHRYPKARPFQVRVESQELAEMRLEIPD